ncbi:TIM barrel protein [Actinoplanes sp. NPDC048796]|uniref:sugar phosphate isomerase/epimerase family protein n=1 Tax=Actinoplanes sp. NPDC048796 TaxID=3155640 RepID=UPI0033C0F0BB
MRLRHPSGRIVHLGCEIASRSSSGTASNLPGIVRQLDTYGAVRARLGADALGVNLWLPPALAAALAVESRARTRLRAELDARRLEVVTLSGAPFAEGGGGTSRPPSNAGASPAGASAVVAPPNSDAAEAAEKAEKAGEAGEAAKAGEAEKPWTDPARREYTLDLARVLLDLLDDDAVRGTVSTIGLGPRAGWAEAEDKAALGILRRLSHGLADLAWQNGRAVRVGFQPAEGYVLDSPEQTVAALSRVDKDRLGVCLDLGHCERTWDDPAAGIETITDAGLAIVEVRVVAVPGATTSGWRDGLRQLFGPGGPLTENLTLVSGTPTADQITNDVTYLLAELAALGLQPENEPCAAR